MKKLNLIAFVILLSQLSFANGNRMNGEQWDRHLDRLDHIQASTEKYPDRTVLQTTTPDGQIIDVVNRVTGKQVTVGDLRNRKKINLTYDQLGTRARSVGSKALKALAPVALVSLYFGSGESMAAEAFSTPVGISDVTAFQKPSNFSVEQLGAIEIGEGQR